MTITIDSFKDQLVQFSHPGTLTPAEASKLTLMLLEALADDCCDVFFLRFCSRFLTKDSYTELMEERNINKLCAYPLCHEHQARSRSLQWSSVPLPYEYLKYYCTKTHFQCSEFYKSQLSPEALFARKDVTVQHYGSMEYENGITLLEEVLAQRQKGASMRQVLEGLTGLSINQEKDEKIDKMASMLHDIEIVEKEPTQPTPLEDVMEELPDQEKYEYLQDQSKAIDGYILKM
jgi:hypothetical protein